jgi:hypothetical protein
MRLHAGRRQRPFRNGFEDARLMQGPLMYIMPIALGAVALALLIGVLNMARNGSSERSQVLMRWRVGLQFLAIIIMMSALYLAGR